jgi:histidine triad (HIT) family protein
MTACVFCTIIARHSPDEILYQDELVTAFCDIRPLAPVHILIVPNKHIASVNEASSEDEPLLGRLFTAARKIAQEQGVAQSGYRLVMNNGNDGGQGVFHIHLHLLGGRRMSHMLG